MSKSRFFGFFSREKATDEKIINEDDSVADANHETKLPEKCNADELNVLENAQFSPEKEDTNSTENFTENQESAGNGKSNVDENEEDEKSEVNGQVDTSTTDQQDQNEEEFEVINDEEFNETHDKTLLSYNQKLESALAKLEEVGTLSEKDLEEIKQEIRHLEEKLYLWREVRTRTIERLREIADYIDSLGRKTGVAKVVGNSGGILAGGLTVAGGVMTVMTAGAAAPVLLAGAGLGLASGITGGAATLTKKVLSSRQMKEVIVALEVDAAATSELKIEVDRMKEDSRLLKVTSMAFTVGGLASSTKGFVDLFRGSNPGDTIKAGLEVVGKIFGEDVNKEITKLLLQSGGRMLSGAVTSVFGGVTMLWDVYQLNSGVKELAAGGSEGAQEIRSIAEQLSEALDNLADGTNDQEKGVDEELSKSKEDSEGGQSENPSTDEPAQDENESIETKKVPGPDNTSVVDSR